MNGWTPVSLINLGSRGTCESGVFLSISRTLVGMAVDGGNGRSTSSDMELASETSSSVCGGVGGKCSCFCNMYLECTSLDEGSSIIVQAHVKQLKGRTKMPWTGFQFLFRCHIRKQFQRREVSGALCAWKPQRSLKHCGGGSPRWEKVSKAVNMRLVMVSEAARRRRSE